MKFCIVLSIVFLLFTVCCASTENPCRNKATTRETLDCVKELSKQAALKAAAWHESNNKNQAHKDESLADMTRKYDQLNSEFLELADACSQHSKAILDKFE